MAAAPIPRKRRRMTEEEITQIVEDQLPDELVSGGRRLSEGNAMFSMTPISNNYGSYVTVQTGRRQLPVTSGNFNDPSMARPPSRFGGVTSQNHLGNGIMITQDSGQQQQQPIQTPTNMNINQRTGQDQMVDMSVPGLTATTTPIDPEICRQIQQQLRLLLHAYECSKKEPRGDTTNCALPHCRTMKDVLRHMHVCSQGKFCQVADCASSRQIIAHWRACKRPECEVCLPLKSVPTSSSSAPSISMQQIRTLPMPPTGHSSNTNDVPGPSSGPFYAENFNETTLDSNSLHQSNQMQQGLGNMPDGVNIPQVPEMDTLPGQASDSGNFCLSPTVEHPWHSDVHKELRNHLVQKFVQAIIPSPMKVSFTDERLKKLVNFAKKVECDMYEQAKSRSEYYHFLAEKIFKVQKEMEEKKAGRSRTNRGDVMDTSEVPGMVSLPGQTSDSGNFCHPPRVERSWHSDIHEELRNHVVQKLVKAIFPTPKKIAPTDERMKKLVKFAKKVECDMHEQAKSKSEYYHLIAEKIFKIQKELDEKRAERNRANSGAVTDISQVPGMVSRPGLSSELYPARIGRSWHKNMKEELRDSSVRRLVQAIFPPHKRSPADDWISLSYSTDEWKIKQENYARKLEYEFFERATTKKGYYRLLNEKIDEFRADLQEKELQDQSNPA